MFPGMEHLHTTTAIIVGESVSGDYYSNGRFTANGAQRRAELQAMLDSENLRPFGQGPHNIIVVSQTNSDVFGADYFTVSRKGWVIDD